MRNLIIIVMLMLVSNRAHAFDNIINIELETGKTQRAMKSFISCNGIIPTLTNNVVAKRDSASGNSEPNILRPNDFAIDCTDEPLIEIGTVDDITYYKKRYRVNKEGYVRARDIIGVYAKNVQSTDYYRLYVGGNEPDTNIIDASIINNKYGNILAIDACQSGSGKFDISEYFIWNGTSKTWSKLIPDWVNGVSMKLNLKNGNYIRDICGSVNIKNMTATANIQNTDDSNCCPSGGELIVALGIKNTKLIYKSYQLVLGYGEYMLQAISAKNNGNFDAADKLALNAYNKAVTGKEKNDASEFRKSIPVEKNMYMVDKYKVKGDYNNAAIYATKAVNLATGFESKRIALIKRFELNRGFAKTATMRSDAKILCQMGITSIFTCLENMGKPTYRCSEVSLCDIVR